MLAVERSYARELASAKLTVCLLFFTTAGNCSESMSVTSPNTSTPLTNELMTCLARHTTGPNLVGALIDSDAVLPSLSKTSPMVDLAGVRKDECVSSCCRATGELKVSH